MVDNCGFSAATESLYGGQEERARYFDTLRQNGNTGDGAILAALDREKVEIKRFGEDPAKQADYIKQIAKFALANDNARLRDLLYQYVEYSQQNNRGKFATEILSIIKDSDRENSLGKLKEYRLNKHFDYKADEYILQTVTSSFTMKDLVCTQDVREEFEYFIKERQQTEALVQMDIPVSNKILLHGPSGCGKTLSAYVLAGELNRPLIIVNLGTVISSRLGETSKNLTQIFKTAVQEKAIVLLDEFDSLGKIRDYDQDHGEMKRVVNTILQLFDFVSQDTIIIAATNQLQMIDEALIRRFDLSIKMDLPNSEQVHALIQYTIKDRFVFDDEQVKENIINSECRNLSYYVIKRALLNAIKRNILDGYNDNIIRTNIWKKLLNDKRIS